MKSTPGKCDVESCSPLAGAADDERYATGDRGLNHSNRVFGSPDSETDYACKDSYMLFVLRTKTFD